MVPVVISSVQTQLDGLIADLDARIIVLDREIATALADGAWATSAAVLTTSLTGDPPLPGEPSAGWVGLDAGNGAAAQSVDPHQGHRGHRGTP